NGALGQVRSSPRIGGDSPRHIVLRACCDCGWKASAKVDRLPPDCRSRLSLRCTGKSHIRHYEFHTGPEDVWEVARQRLKKVHRFPETASSLSRIPKLDMNPA